jgi:Pyruvate/2-oxoacid:ferredoxin oxidoreductase delta subunit
MSQPAVIFCQCKYAQVLPEAVKNAALKALQDSGQPFELVDDLCELSARRDPAMGRVASGGPVKIAACFPRAVKWLFHAAGTPLNGESAEVVNLRSLSAEQAHAALLNGAVAPNIPAGKSLREDGPKPTLKSEVGAWKPWFPVIDYDRCTNCMQCLSFCLFGVYGVDDEKRIQVQNQDNCKTNCPACSRVCPEAAIMFPKYKAGPINGDIVSDNDLNREKMKIDISALLGGDVYSMLRTRSERAQSRFSKERDADKALAERQKCLVKLGAIMNEVPPEVLMSLPSPEEIARKAEEAAAKAKAALEPTSTAST